jgi:hypothetical protein
MSNKEKRTPKACVSEGHPIEKAILSALTRQRELAVRVGCAVQL